MKKFFNSIGFVFKALLLVVLLVFGWVFINVQNLVKGKKAQKGPASTDLFGPGGANADIPHPGTGCPLVAVFDGNEFRIENDFLPGDFKQLPVVGMLFSQLSRWQKTMAPDLLKLTVAPHWRDGEAALRLQEIELEESFVSRVKLIRIVHPRESEVLINAQNKTYHAVSREKFEQGLIFPSAISLNGTQAVDGRFGGAQELWREEDIHQNLFGRGDRVDFTFRNLDRSRPAYLVVKSAYRDWMAGEEISFANDFFAKAFSARSIATLAFAFVAVVLAKTGLVGYITVLPFFFGVQGKSIVLAYNNGVLGRKSFFVHKPRGFKQSVELVPLPKSAIRKDNTALVSATFTKRHSLSFVGVVQGLEEVASREDSLDVKRAVHSRLGDVTESLREKFENAVHMIPGDVVDVAVKGPVVSAGEGQKETYLFQSAGFYTKIRPEYKALAGNWEKKLSGEAREHLKNLVPLSRYR